MSYIKIIKQLIIAGVLLSPLANIAYAASPLSIKNAWSPAAPPVAKVMAGYMTINNKGQTAIKITAAESPLFKKVEIHLSEMKNGMMSMIKQENLNIPANGEVELKQGGLHMMLMGKLKPIKTGSTIPVTITFDNGETKKINVIVKEDNKPQSMHDHHHHH